MEINVYRLWESGFEMPLRQRGRGCLPGINIYEKAIFHSSVPCIKSIKPFEYKNVNLVVSPLTTDNGE